MRKFTKKKTREYYTEDSTWKDKGKPEQESKDVKVELSEKALRHLPHSSYSLLADPYSSASNPSSPYPVLNAFNRKIGGNYAGTDNLDGGNVQQYANSNTSKLLQAFDVARLQVGINYRYLPIRPRLVGATDELYGAGLVDEMRKAISEAMSVLQSTTYTQMAFYNFAVVTDLPMGVNAASRKTNINNGATAISAYTKREDVFYATSMYYQIVLQNLLNTLKWHNAFRLKQGTMIKNAWNREVPLLNAFFGLMNKKAFLSLIDGLNLSFEGEYIDLDWARQAAMVNYAPSRRSDSILDPVLEIQTSYQHPNSFKIYALDPSTGLIADPDDKPLFDDADLKGTIDIAGVSTDVTFWSAIEHLNDLMSMEAVTLWARTNNYTGIAATDNQRYNTIKKYFDVLTICTNIFKPAFSDYREALDTLSRAGIISWVKGFRPQTEPNTTAPLFHNLLTDDIYRLILGGADSVEFNEYTKRFRTFTLWNMYTGIPESDTKAGGAFLTLSFKNLTMGADSDSNKYYLPILFDNTGLTTDKTGNFCVLVSRDGKEVVVDSVAETIVSNSVMSRLMPLTSQASLKLRIPRLQLSNTVNKWLNDLSDSQAAPYKAFINKALQTMVGYCVVKKATNTNYNLDSDIVAIYQIEIEDLTNMAITYARANSPIRGTTSGEGLLGFFGMKGSK